MRIKGERKRFHSKASSMSLLVSHCNISVLMSSEYKGCHPVFMRPWRHKSLSHLLNLFTHPSGQSLSNRIFNQECLHSSLSPNKSTITTTYKIELLTMV